MSSDTSFSPQHNVWVETQYYDIFSLCYLIQIAVFYFKIKCQFQKSLVMTQLFMLVRCTILCGGVCWSSSGGLLWPTPCWCSSPSTLISLKTSLGTGETSLVSQKSSTSFYKSLTISSIPLPHDTMHTLSVSLPFRKTGSVVIISLWFLYYGKVYNISISSNISILIFISI